MTPRLLRRIHVGQQEMGIAIPQQQHDLGKHHAGEPDMAPSAEPWRDRLRDEGLDEKQEEGTQKRNHTVDRPGSWDWGAQNRPLIPP